LLDREAGASRRKRKSPAERRKLAAWHFRSPIGFCPELNTDSEHTHHTPQPPAIHAPLGQGPPAALPPSGLVIMPSEERAGPPPQNKNLLYIYINKNLETDFSSHETYARSPRGGLTMGRTTQGRSELVELADDSASFCADATIPSSPRGAGSMTDETVVPLCLERRGSGTTGT